MAEDGKSFEPVDDLRKDVPRGSSPNTKAEKSSPPTDGNPADATPTPDDKPADLTPALSAVVKDAHLAEVSKPDGMLLRKNARGLSLPKVDADGCYHNIMPGFTKPNFACCFKYEVAMVDMNPPKQPSREEAAVRLPSTDRINLHAVYRNSPWGCPCEACVIRNKAGGIEAAKAANVTLPIASPSNEELAATWCSHASYIVTVGGYTILTDPVWSDRCSPVQMMGPMRMVPVPIALHDMPYVDVVTISHNHYDHMCTTTIQHLCRHNHNLMNKKRRVGRPSRELMSKLEANYEPLETPSGDEDTLPSPCKSPLYKDSKKMPTERDPKFRAHTHPVFVVPMGMKTRYFVPLQSEVPELNLDLVVECMWWDTANVTAAIYKHRKMMEARMAASEEDAVLAAVQEMDADYVPPTPPLLITVVPCQHWSMRQGLWDRDRELWGSFVYRIGHEPGKAITAPSPNRAPTSALLNPHHSRFGTHKWTLFHSGDTGFYDLIYEEIFKAFGAFDFSMIAIGAYEPRKLLRQQHLDPIESVEIHDRLKSRRSAAMHWGTWILSDEPIDEPPKLLSMAMSEKYRPFMHKFAGTPVSVLSAQSTEATTFSATRRSGMEAEDPSEQQLKFFRGLSLEYLNAGRPNTSLMTTKVAKAKAIAIKNNIMPKTLADNQLPNDARICETNGVRVERPVATIKPELRTEVENSDRHPSVVSLTEAILHNPKRTNDDHGEPVLSTIFQSIGHGTTETEAIFHHEIREGMKHLGGRTYPYFDCENPFRALMHGETWVIPPHKSQPQLD
eukprot:GILK01015045.1.p1 GENE.GILK01015045.1~~GILK01015045.1.p1  ORF type:complete len:814 (+),score=42.63 GILK01015045.1:83-2443(+)